MWTTNKPKQWNTPTDSDKWTQPPCTCSLISIVECPKQYMKNQLKNIVICMHNMQPYCGFLFKRRMMHVILYCKLYCSRFSADQSTELPFFSHCLATSLFSIGHTPVLLIAIGGYFFSCQVEAFRNSGGGPSYSVGVLTWMVMNSLWPVSIADCSRPSCQKMFVGLFMLFGRNLFRRVWLVVLGSHETLLKTL